MRDKRKMCKAGILVGALMVLLPVTITVISMRAAFATLGTSGIGDPATLIGAVSEIRAGTVLLFPLLLAGVTLLTLSLLQLQKGRQAQPPISPPAMP